MLRPSMRDLTLSTVIVAVCAGLLAPNAEMAAYAATSAATPAAAPAYPIAPRGDHVDQYRSNKVPDPYRWMEDIDSPATRTWVEAEAKLSSDFLAAIPGREQIARRLTEIWNYARWNAPEKHGSQWFYLHTDGLQNQSVLFTTAKPEQPAP